MHMILLLLIHCIVFVPLYVRVCVLSLFCNVVLSVLSSFTIILLRKKELVVWVSLSRSEVGWPLVCDSESFS